MTGSCRYCLYPTTTALPPPAPAASARSYPPIHYARRPHSRGARTYLRRTLPFAHATATCPAARLHCRRALVPRVLRLDVDRAPPCRFSATQHPYTHDTLTAAALAAPLPAHTPAFLLRAPHPSHDHLCPTFPPPAFHHCSPSTTTAPFL